jgi:microsomal dipeptidase-like Zn-dependent dipeptidase
MKSSQLLFPLVPILLSVLLIQCTTPNTSDQLERAKRLHESVITIDTHVDINTNNFTADRNYTTDLPTQVTLPKMEEGGLDVAWFIVYTGQDTLSEEGYAAAYENAIDKFDAIHRLVDEYAPDRIELAVNAEQVRDIQARGKKVAMIGVENAYPIGTDLSRIKEFHERGARYMSLSHNGHSQFCDSNTGERDNVWLYNGLSDLGKQAIVEMNKWGIMIDLSHPSKESNMQTIALSKAPVIASHSSARTINDVSRNLDDEELLALKENGGVVQTVAFRSYVDSEKHAQWQADADELFDARASALGFERKSWADIRTMEASDRDQYMTQYRALQAEVSATMSEKGQYGVDVSDFIDHLDYMVNLIGINHVGISSDFDGGGGVHGWDDASETFSITLELVKRGYSDEEITKLWGANLLRVLDEVEAVAASMQGS